MQKIQNLSIHLHYTFDESSNWTFLELSKKSGVIQPKHLNPEDFYWAEGGIRIYHNRLFCFLDVAHCGEVISYVHFLINSIINLNTILNLTPEGAIEPHPKNSLLSKATHLDSSCIECHYKMDQIVLNYFNSIGLAPEDRGSRYFENLIIDPADWRQACKIALDEYFFVAQKILHDNVKTDALLLKIHTTYQKLF